VSRRMKAAVFEGPEKLIVKEVELARCGSDDIIIKVHACGICGGDIRNFYNGLRHGVKSQIMGHEFTGTVSEVGANVTKFKVGDKVAAAPDVSCGECYYCKRGWVNLCENHKMIGTHWPGGFAEYVHIPALVLRRGFIHPVPEGVSLDAACLSEPASSVIASMENAHVSLGDSVLIIGDGPIGCLFIEIARANGASKIIMAGRMRRQERVKKFKPDLLIDASASDVATRVREFTSGLGVDVAVCANPVVATQEQAVQSVRKRGRVILFGGVPKNAPMTSLNSNTIHYNEIEVAGAFSYEVRHHLAALAAIQKGLLTPDNYFTKVVALEDVAEGFVSAKTGKNLKILVKP